MNSIPQDQSLDSTIALLSEGYTFISKTLRSLLPSKADMDLTHKLKQGGQFLDLPILDHLILSKESYYSFADSGVL